MGLFSLRCKNRQQNKGMQVIQKKSIRLLRCQSREQSCQTRDCLAVFRSLFSLLTSMFLKKMYEICSFADTGSRPKTSTFANKN